MAIPPFPSQDLAKLVLGYLAEEQLMTAYDEFLLASPYLDVLRNEYDRIFMTSLKSILAEYRAVKIYVETCKPFLLRKKLFQCSNLLEIFKFLVSYVDINRLQAQETSVDKISSKQTSYTRSACDVCYSVNCTCKEKSLKSGTLPTSQIEASTLENSIETTALSDLPGNSVNKKNLNKDLSVANVVSQTSLDVQVIDTSIESKTILSSTNRELQRKEDNGTNVSQLPLDNNTHINTQDLNSRSDESKRKIEEFNNIYNLVCNNNSSLLPKISPSNIQDVTNRTHIVGAFQNFASALNGCSDKNKTIVPDLSNLENVTRSTERKEKKIHINQITNIKGQPTPQYLLKVGTTNNQCSANQNLQQSCTQNSELSKIKLLPKFKPDDQKIKIISDVKVDNLKGNLKVPSKPTTSTPLMQMQTIVINGTPAYKEKPQMGTNFTYTKDEIMAMPTIIIVPASGSKKASAPIDQVSTVQCVNTETIPTSSTKTITSTTRVLGPLIIDVSSNNTTPVLNTEIVTEPILKEASRVETEKYIVQTVDLTHNSVPKDTNLTSNKSSTPQILPPLRKSSSTPRRTSHVRVLDFTTPRRILHETINEQDANKVLVDETTKENTDSDQSTHRSIDNMTVQKTDSNSTVIKPSTKENNIKLKKSNWDADLRFLAVQKNDDIELTPISKQKKSKTIKKKISPEDQNVCKLTKSDKITDSDSKSKATPKVKKKKKIKYIVDVDKVIEEERPVANMITECPKMPTVNVITDTDRNNGSKDNLDQVDHVKVNYSDERVDTPEAERLSLQNVIGAKLNISDLLETPYKQVLYDIQMETPKFLGPDLPDEPISDIKIMNIPTPRFLNTPKPFQATPSSYSSRPTDYSSGGSYYKPDDQDYVPSSEVLECAITVVEEPTKVIEKPPVAKSEMKEKSQKSTRPQRKCTRNVSYRSPHVTAKTKDNDNADKASMSSETSNLISKEKKTNKPIESKNRLKSKKEEKQKNDNKKKTSLHKTPTKRVTPKKYIRIKPFRKTPVKDSPMKGRKKTSDALRTLSAKSLSRKRTTSKEKNATVEPVVSSVPTKSRRKSSTPRKLHCTKSFNSDSAEQNSSDLSKNPENNAENITKCCQDSDSEQQPLRWSDDGSQETISKSNVDNYEIDKIKEYIKTSVPEKKILDDIEGSLHIDLVRRGFDFETAKIIERDLLDATPVQDTTVQSTTDITNMRIEAPDVSDKIDSDGSFSNSTKQLKTVQNEDEYEEEEIELSCYECNQETKNYFTLEFDESKFVGKDIPKMKDKFSMEVCIEDGVSIRLRAVNFESVFENSDEIVKDHSPNETDAAVNSISNIDKLYTPIKDPRTQCYELFDSTLTSIDTPLKSETVYETTVTEIVLEVENIDGKYKTETKKRKRIHSGNSDESANKKTKSDTQYLLNTTNIQNIDIETVLSKLHGP